MMDDDVKASILKIFSSGKKGRAKIAESMVAPIKRQLGYQSIGRRAFSKVEKTCEECGVTYRGWHPDNGCALGTIENVMDE